MEEQTCLFCSIAAGKQQSKKIYEDELAIVILDIYPANPAHLLVLPKEHYFIFNQMPKEAAEHFGKLAKACSELLFKIIKPDGVNIFIANGAVAGQRAPHFIMHVIPRFEGDGLNFEIAEKEMKEEDLEGLYERLKNKIKEYFPDKR